MTRKQIDDFVDEYYPDEKILLADGFDDAFLGIAPRMNQSPVAVYDRQRCVEVLVERDGMTWEEADEFVSYNVEGAFVGEGTPLYLQRPVTESR